MKNYFNVKIISIIIILVFFSFILFGIGSNYSLNKYISKGHDISKEYEKIKNFKKEKLFLDFSDSMNQKSVLKNLRIYPEVTYTSKWIDDKNLEIEINDDLIRETDLFVNISKNTLKKDGKKLLNTYSKQFKISGNAIISFVSPTDKVDNIFQPITVSFSKPIASLTNLLNQKKCPIEIKPFIDGKCVWITSETFQFKPEKGFPYGEEYKIKIPSGIKTIAGDKTIHGKDFTIKTPLFSSTFLNENNIKKDSKLEFSFNDEVSIKSFIKNFKISNYSNKELTFSYGKTEDGLDQVNNIVTVFPKKGDWGYAKNYEMKISKNLTSERGSIGLKSDIVKHFKVFDIISDISPFVWNDDSKKNENKYDNIIFQSNKIDVNKIKKGYPIIIPKNNPSVLFTFEEDMDLDKSLFHSPIDFDLNYLTEEDNNYDLDLKDNNYKINKKGIILTFKGAIKNDFTFKLNLKKYNTSDLIINFKTKENNEIKEFKFIDYNNLCINTKFPINSSLDSNLSKYFEFDKFASIGQFMFNYDYNNINKLCGFDNKANGVNLKLKLNPSSDYKVTIKKDIIDYDNYPLDKDYTFSFSTNEAKNEDKYVSLYETKGLNIIPKNIDDYGVAVESNNISKFNATVCEGDFDLNAKNYINNPNCKTKIVHVKDLGFKKTLTVLNVEKILDKKLDNKSFNISVSKIDKDQIKKDKKNIYYDSKTYNSTFIFSDKAAVVKNNILWLYNFSDGNTLPHSIEKIEAYFKGDKYYNNRDENNDKLTFLNNIGFKNLDNGLYSLDLDNKDTKKVNFLLITLQSKEKVFFDYSNYNNGKKDSTYIFTDKPIYKAGEKVKISGFSRIVNDNGGFSINQSPLGAKIFTNSNFNKNLDPIQGDENGYFNFEYQIPSDAKLGNYYISIGSNVLNFLVEEYEKPDFKVETKPKKDINIFSKNAQIDVSSDYFAGFPVSNGEGSYVLKSLKYNFDGGKTKGYTFGKSNNSFLNDYYIPSKTREIENGKFILNSDGKYTINVHLGDEDAFYTINTTIKDPNSKKSISSSTNFKGYGTNEFLGIKFDKYSYSYKDKANIGFVVTDYEGNKLPQKNFKLEISKIDYKNNNNIFRRNNEKVLTNILTEDIQTDKKGFALKEFVFDDFGEYIFKIYNGSYETTQYIQVFGEGYLYPKEKNNIIQVVSEKDEYKVSQEAEFNIISPIKGVKGLLIVNKEDKVLEERIIDINDYNTKIYVKVGKEHIPNFSVFVYLVKDMNNSLKEREDLKELRIEMNKLEQELQKEKKYFNNYYFYFGEQENNENNKDNMEKLENLRMKEREILDKILPEYYYGYSNTNVNLEPIILKTDIKLDKKTYSPSDPQRIELDISDNNGKGIDGVAVISIVDESLLSMQDFKKDIITFFYSIGENNNINFFDSLSFLIKRLEYTDENYDYFNDGLTKQMRFGMETNAISSDSPTDSIADTGMSNGMEEGMFKMTKAINNNLDKKSIGENKIRTEFSDSAFYKEKILVKNGKAVINVPKLPDNLTTWVIRGYAFTDDTKVGEIDYKFNVKKSLIVLPQIPRFFISGDKAEIGGIVYNNTSNEKQIEVSLNMTNIRNFVPMKKTVKIPPESSLLVSFPVDINTKKTQTDTIKTNILLNAKTEGLRDTIQLKKLIYPSQSSEYVFTNGSTNNLSYEEKLDFSKVLNNSGYLEVSLGATILNNLTKDTDSLLKIDFLNNLYDKILFIKNAEALEKLYKALGKDKEYEKLKVYNEGEEKNYSINKAISIIKNSIKLHLRDDGLLGYSDTCFYFDCKGSLYLTRDFINSRIIVDGIDNKKLYESYKNNLILLLEDKTKDFNIYDDVLYFLPMAINKDKDFIKKYFKEKEKKSNYDIINYIKFYSILGENKNEIKKYIHELKNSVLIEARGSILTATKEGNKYSKGDNFNSFYDIYTTANFVSLLIKNNISDKLLLENLTRFLISTRATDGLYYKGIFYEMIDSLILYINDTSELKNTQFEGKTYLNGKNIFSEKFDKNNLFGFKTKTFHLSEFIKPGENSLGFEKTGTGKLYYDVGVRYFLPLKGLKSRDEGIIVSKKYYDFEDYKKSHKKVCYFFYCFDKKIKNIESIKEAKKGSLILGEIQVVLDRPRTNVSVTDFIPAGAEILNVNFSNVSSDVGDYSGNENKGYFSYGFSDMEQKNTGINLFAEKLEAGTYTFNYVISASYKGKYILKPTISEIKTTPEIWGRSEGGIFEIK